MGRRRGGEGGGAGGGGTDTIIAGFMENGNETCPIYSRISSACRSLTDSAEGRMRGAKETLGRMTSVTHSVRLTR